MRKIRKTYQKTFRLCTDAEEKAMQKKGGQPFLTWVDVDVDLLHLRVRKNGSDADVAATPWHPLREKLQRGLDAGALVGGSRCQLSRAPSALKAARDMLHLHFGVECEASIECESQEPDIEEPHEPSIECESQEDIQAAIQEVQCRYQQKHEELALQFKKEVKQMQKSSSGRWMMEQQDMGWIEFPNGMRMRPRFQYKTWVKDAPGTGGAAMSESESSSSSSSSSIGSKQSKTLVASAASKPRLQH